VLIPIAKNADGGVSVEYMPDENKRWFVFRASYGRELKAREYLLSEGTYCYIPQQYVWKIVKGKRVRTLQNLTPNLIFVYTTPQQAEAYVKTTPRLAYLSYYYNHFKQENGKNPPLIIPNDQMHNFILTTVSKHEDVMFLNGRQASFSIGNEVRVVAGPFRGVEGKVTMLSGQQRVVISIDGFGLIATAQVPTDCLEENK